MTKVKCVLITPLYASARDIAIRTNADKNIRYDRSIVCNSL